MTEAEKAQVEATQDVSTFLQDPEGLRIFNVLLSLRRAYVVAYAELQKMLDVPSPEDPEKRQFHELSCDIIVQSAMHAAAKPFEEKQLFVGLENAVLPWLREKMAEHARMEEEQMLELEQRRRETPVPIGFKFGDDSVLSRHKSLTIAGDRTNVASLLNIASDSAQRANMCVLRFGFAAEPEKQSAMYCSLADGEWADVAKNPSAFGRFFNETLLKRMNVPPDLLIVDDLSLAHPALFVGQPVGAVAGNAHKVLWRVCQQLGCALLSGVPSEQVDVTAPEFEQLRTFSQLRLVDAQGNII